MRSNHIGDVYARVGHDDDKWKYPPGVTKREVSPKSLELVLIQIFGVHEKRKGYDVVFFNHYDDVIRK